MTNEELVSTYVKIRSAIQEKEDEHKEELQVLKDSLAKISDALLQVCNEGQMEGFKTDAGTVSKSVTSRFWASDWDAMYNFIEEHNAPYLLEKRIHNTNMKEFLDENKGVQPSGLQVDRKYVIKVRKPTKR